MRKYLVIGLIFILAGCSEAPHEILRIKILRSYLFFIVMRL